MSLVPLEAGSLLFTSDTKVTSVPTKTETLTNPLLTSGLTTTGCIVFTNEQQKFVSIRPTATVAAKVAVFYIYKWIHRTLPATSTLAVRTVWIPVLLGAVTCTSGTTAGVSGGLIGTGRLWAGSIVLVAGSDTNSIQIASNTSNNPGEFMVNTFYSDGIQIVAYNAANDSNWNAVYQLFDTPPIPEGQ